MIQPAPDNAQAWQNLADAAAAAPPALSPLMALSSDVAFGDWDDLFCAVKSRLTLTVGELSALSEPQARGTADRIRASVLECVGALDQLQTTLTNEIARRQQLELEVFEAQTALALAHAELVGTQGAERQGRQRASRDSLTLLPDRNFFRQRIDHALAHAEPPGPGARGAVSRPRRLQADQRHPRARDR